MKKMYTDLMIGNMIKNKWLNVYGYIYLESKIVYCFCLYFCFFSIVSDT